MGQRRLDGMRCRPNPVRQQCQAGRVAPVHSGSPSVSVWKIDVVENGNETGERCGRCGELVPAAATVCPACGALLDAYRTPAESPDSTVVTLLEALKGDRPDLGRDRPDVSIDEMNSSAPEAIEIELAEDAPDASSDATL